jgi:carboxylesterase type B
MSNLTSNYGFNVFSYYYNYQISSSEFQPLYSAVHADELAMVFAQPLSLKAQPFLTSMNYWPPKSNNTYSSLERNISSLFVNYWSNFVATGNVNGIGNQMWSVWNQNGGSFLNMTGITNLSFTPVNTIYSMAQDTICQMLYPQWVW